MVECLSISFKERVIQAAELDIIWSLKCWLISNYPQTLDFIVTKVNHNLQRNAWTTKLETQATKIIEDTKDKGQVNTNDILLSDEFRDVITNIETSKPVQSFSTPSKIIDTNTIFGYPANATYNQSITPDQAAAAVNPFLRGKFLPFFKGLLETGGYTYKITSCFRTLERSQNFRDQLGKVQPYAGRSNHNVGTAIDMIVIRDSDNKLFTKSTPFQIWQDQLPHLMELYQKLGLFWGGGGRASILMRRGSLTFWRPSKLHCLFQEPIDP